MKAVIELARALVGEVEDEFNGEVTAKCAIALGKCHYGYLGPSEHTELTIVGTPLTELFRLESDCPKRSIIMLRSLFDTVRDGFTILPADEFPFLKWKYSTEELSLRGVGKKEVAILTLDGD